MLENWCYHSLCSLYHCSSFLGCVIFFCLIILCRRFIFNCKLGVLQYTVIRIATTLTALYVCVDYSPTWPVKFKRQSYLVYGMLLYVVQFFCSICELCGVYKDGNWNFLGAYPYLAIVNNVSQTWALYCLVLFYEGMKEELKPVQALAKFLCVKLVVFATFWYNIITSLPFIVHIF